jgi:DNA-directed RNA polymerase specialized sigma24 family protein
VVLRYYHEYSEAETAALLGCAVGTVKSQAAKALAKMRGQLSAAPAPVRQSR